jgi:NADH:ubiquinone reductase (H+-translocating)
MASEPHVVILGGGFAGVGALAELTKIPVRVTLIDRNNYQMFQPLLYQVATDVLSPDEVGFPLREKLHGHPARTFHRAAVTGIDLGARRVTVEGMEPIGYDYLVIAVGAAVNFFGTKGAAEHAFPLYTMHDAVRLKEHILASFEAADRNPALVDDGALTLCIVGGGATGVEVAGALAELLQAEMKGDYPNLPVDRAEIHLYERGTKLLGTFKPVLQEYAKATLEKRGVRVHLGEGVAEIEPTRVRLESGGEVKAYTLVWAAGLQANSLASSFGIELVHDRVPVNADLSLKGHPEVFAAGDIAVVTDAATGRPLPQLGSVAKQAGEQAGRNLARLVRGEGTEPFRYRDRGTMATVGRGAAVVELGGCLTLTGYLAWLSWLFVHLLLLSGGIEKSLTLRDWAWNLLTRRRGKRIVVD